MRRPSFLGYVKFIVEPFFITVIAFALAIRLHCLYPPTGGLFRGIDLSLSFGATGLMFIFLGFTAALALPGWGSKLGAIQQSLLVKLSAEGGVAPKISEALEREDQASEYSDHVWAFVIAGVVAAAFGLLSIT